MEEHFELDFYKKVIDQLHANIYITDVETDRIVYMNDFMKDTFEVEKPEGKLCWQVLQEGQNARCSFCKIGELLKKEKDQECLWREHNTKNGRTYLNYDFLEEREGKVFHVQYSTDITENLQLSLDAAMDELTMILNRKAGRKRLDEMLKQMDDREQLVIALYDINGLKWVNDTYGHYEGDRLLHYVATNMKDDLEEPDFMFRLSGDEFIIVFVGKEIFQAESWLRRMLEMLKKGRVQAGISYDVSFSYGLVKVRGKERLGVSDVLALADTQMYIQKRDYHIAQGKKRFLDNREIREQLVDKPLFEYSRNSMFDAFSETVDGYAFAGNLKNGTFMYSKKMVREFGLPKQILEDAAAFWGEIVHPEDREFFLRSNQEIADGKTDHHAIRYRAKNYKGEWISLLCKGRVVPDNEGTPDLFAGVIYNLEDKEVRRRVNGAEMSPFYFINEPGQEVRKEMEEDLQEFVNTNIPGGVMATKDDDDLTILCFNQSLLRYLGSGTYEEFIQQTGGKFRGLIYEEDQEKVTADIREQLRNKNFYKVYYRIMQNQGKLVWVYEVGQYIHNREGEKLILSFLVDATEEMEKEQELRFINENNHSGVFKALVTDRLELTYANDGFYKLYGYTRAQAEAELDNDISLRVVPEDLRRIYHEVKDALRAGENQVVLEYRIRKRDDSIAWVHLIANMTRLADGKKIMLGLSMDITRRRMLEEQLHHTELLYQFVQDYTKLQIWEYKTEEQTVILQSTHGRTKEKQFLNIPENLIAAGKVDLNSIDEFRSIHERIRAGEDMVMGTIHFLGVDGTDIWEKITYISLKDDAGNVEKAIGIAEDVTAQKEAEIRAFNEEKMREVMVQDTIYSAHVNLTTKKLEMIWDAEKKLEDCEIGEVSYEDVYQRLLSVIANEDDRKRFEEEYSAEKIFQAAKEGSVIREFEFRQIYGQGTIIWVNLTFKIIDSPTTGNKILFIYARNIDLAKRRELALQKKAELDETTGLYNLATTKLLVKDILEREDRQDGEDVFLLMNIDRFREVNRIGGFMVGDELLRQVAEKLTKQIPPTAVAGRINGDIFAVYFCSQKTKKGVRGDVEKLMKALCGSYVCGGMHFDITVSVGAVCPGLRKVSYEYIYQNTYYALDAAKRGGGNQLVFYRDMVPMKLQVGKFDNSLAQLSEQGLNWIKRGETRKEVYRLFLEYIGKCYGAEEVTLFQRIPGTGAFLRVVGWNAYQKGETLEILPERIKYLEKALRKSGEKHFLYIDSPERDGYEEMLRAYDVEALDYSVFLMGEYEKEQLQFGVLVEKCDDRIMDGVAREYVMEMIRWTDHLYEVREEYERALWDDRNTGVMNYESYGKRLEGLNEDSLITLGMVGVQMVDMKRYNQQYGNIKGDEMLSFTAKLMTRLFGRSNCYRLGRTSFFAVCENVVYEEFRDRCQQFVAEIEDNYAEWIVTANAWEQSSISAEKMQDQIEEKLLVAQNKKKSNNAISEKTVKELLVDIREQIESGSFCAYLQPKVDAESETICGAEALIRLIDREKGIIPPGTFLPVIERAGLIRYIDLFVLESVCRMIKEWMASGWQPFPISLNYSRATILEPDILEETNQIVERYGIPKNLLEIEITESIGSIDNMSLKNIVDGFREQGYRTALDDYGSEYSNVYVLYSLQLNTLKLDRRIINDIYHDEKARIVVENIIDICKKFRVQCVAEGVETKEHLEVLREMSCDIIQGYYINKPLSEEEFYRTYISDKK